MFKSAIMVVRPSDILNRLHCAVMHILLGSSFYGRGLNTIRAYGTTLSSGMQLIPSRVMVNSVFVSLVSVCLRPPQLLSEPLLFIWD